MRQVVKKEINVKIYRFLLYKTEILTLGLYNFMVVEYETRIQKKGRFLRDFQGNSMFETDIIYGDSPITAVH